MKASRRDRIYILWRKSAFESMCSRIHVGDPYSSSPPSLFFSWTTNSTTRMKAWPKSFSHEWLQWRKTKRKRMQYGNCSRYYSKWKKCPKSKGRGKKVSPGVNDLLNSFPFFLSIFSRSKKEYWKSLSLSLRSSSHEQINNKVVLLTISSWINMTKGRTIVCFTSEQQEKTLNCSLYWLKAADSDISRCYWLIQRQIKGSPLFVQDMTDVFSASQKLVNSFSSFESKLPTKLLLTNSTLSSVSTLHENSYFTSWEQGMKNRNLISSSWDSRTPLLREFNSSERYSPKNVYNQSRSLSFSVQLNTLMKCNTN